MHTFSHNGFNLVFFYEDSIFNNYEPDLAVCKSIIHRLLYLDNSENWFYCLNEGILGDCHFTIAKTDDKIRMGFSEGDPDFMICYFECDLKDDICIRKISSFIQSIYNDLIDKKLNSFSYKIESIFK